MIIKNTQAVVNQLHFRLPVVRLDLVGRRRLLSALLLIAGVLVSADAHAAAVAARVAAVKGVVMLSLTGDGGEKRLSQGDVVRAGAVISCGAEGGVLLRPAPKVSVVVYMSSKVRYDGADINTDGRGIVRYTVLGGRALFLIEPDAEAPDRPGKVKVSVTTEEGAIEGSKGSWTVLHDDGRTAVAVGQGSTDVSIGGGVAAGGGGVGSQVNVPEGSVIWLLRRKDGAIDAKLVNTATGAMTVIKADGGRDEDQKAPKDLLDQSRQVLDLSSDSTAPGQNGTSGTGGGGTTPTQPSTNPDLSSPRPLLPVVSSDTP